MTTLAALRQRRRRERADAGEIVLAFVIKGDVLTTLLYDAGLLADDAIENRPAIRAALRKQIENLYAWQQAQENVTRDCQPCARCPIRRR